MDNHLVFHKTGLIENWGSGFFRMRQWSLQNGNKEPVFEHRGGALVTAFYKRDSDGVNEGVNEGVKKLEKFIKDNPDKRTNQIADEINIPQKTIERWIKKLKDEQKI